MKFGQQAGRVVSISRAPLGAEELKGEFGIEPAQGQDAFYRVVVRLDGQQLGRGKSSRPLLPGMLVEAEIMGDRRRLLQWLFPANDSLASAD